MTKNLTGIPKLLVKFINVVRHCWFLLLHPEHLILQPPQIQVTPEIVYKTVQNEQGVLQNPTGWFVLSSKGGYLESFFLSLCFRFFKLIFLGPIYFLAPATQAMLWLSRLPNLPEVTHSYPHPLFSLSIKNTHKHRNEANRPPNVSEHNLKTILSIVLSYVKKNPKISHAKCAISMSCASTAKEVSFK